MAISYKNNDNQRHTCYMGLVGMFHQKNLENKCNLVRFDEFGAF